ncbi:hypothetical protein GF336_03325 [Candidatus Woesearchaeota archaeon]|nr:hypothetical protein [Candidatus Woesearchaeota archaeon]
MKNKILYRIALVFLFFSIIVQILSVESRLLILFDAAVFLLVFVPSFKTVWYKILATVYFVLGILVEAVFLNEGLTNIDGAVVKLVSGIIMIAIIWVVKSAE